MVLVNDEDGTSYDVGPAEAKWIAAGLARFSHLIFRIFTSFPAHELWLKVQQKRVSQTDLDRLFAAYTAMVVHDGLRDANYHMDNILYAMRYLRFDWTVLEEAFGNATLITASALILERSADERQPIEILQLFLDHLHLTTVDPAQGPIIVRHSRHPFRTFIMPIANVERLDHLALSVDIDQVNLSLRQRMWTLFYVSELQFPLAFLRLMRKALHPNTTKGNSLSDVALFDWIVKGSIANNFQPNVEQLIGQNLSTTELITDSIRCAPEHRGNKWLMLRSLYEWRLAVLWDLLARTLLANTTEEFEILIGLLVIRFLGR